MNWYCLASFHQRMGGLAKWPSFMGSRTSVCFFVCDWPLKECWPHAQLSIGCGLGNQVTLSQITSQLGKRIPKKIQCRSGRFLVTSLPLCWMVPVWCGRGWPHQTRVSQCEVSSFEGRRSSHCPVSHLWQIRRHIISILGSITSLSDSLAAGDVGTVLTYQQHKCERRDSNLYWKVES